MEPAGVELLPLSIYGIDERHRGRFGCLEVAALIVTDP
jgi:hypothetical protein